MEDNNRNYKDKNRPHSITMLTVLLGLLVFLCGISFFVYQLFN
jgi:hypothetical protein